MSSKELSECLVLVLHILNPDYMRSQHWYKVNASRLLGKYPDTLKGPIHSVLRRLVTYLLGRAVCLVSACYSYRYYII